MKPTKLGKIIHRHNIVPEVAKLLMNLLKTCGDMELSVNSWSLLLYELRLCLIANDNDESIMKNAEYEVSVEEYKILDHYKNLNSTDEEPLELSKVEELRVTKYQQQLIKYINELKEMMTQEEGN